MYDCINCGKQFNHKNDYIKHTQRKKPCENNTEKIIKNYSCPNCNHNFSTEWYLKKHIQDYCRLKVVNKSHKVLDESLKCQSCNKKFSRIDSLNRHINNYCNTVDTDIVAMTEKTRLTNEIIKLKEEMSLLKNYYLGNSTNNYQNNNSPSHNNNSNNNTNSNNINNIQNNITIQLNAFGKEDNSHLTAADYKFALNKGFKSVQELVKLIHFNNKKPENHNVYISNMKDKYANVYDGKDWILKEKTDVLDDLYTTKKDILEERYKELETELPKYTKEKFTRFINEEQGLESIQKQVKNEVKLILYNTRKTPLKIKLG